MIEMILGTAGHIDHGKTALIRALTGVDTDRLPEEKRRGITIELGFAELVEGEVRLGIVDVPGHERFLRQMLAGATGMDLAMLVVAADESVKPQTREHMDVLRTLDVVAGVVVLTKCDLVDESWLELVRQEVADLVRGSILESAPVIPTSVVTEEGIDLLRRTLLETATRAAARWNPDQPPLPFRMAIDRVFSLPGHGTIVTGSVASGRVAEGDPLQILPDGMIARVRSLHNHERAVSEVHRGQRAAINLAGITVEQLRRGHEVCSPEFLSPQRRMSALLRVLPSQPAPLRHRTRLRLHLGTAEVGAEVHCLEAPEIPPASEQFVQLALRHPVACHWNQPFVVRTESPARTIGGGRVLVPGAERIRRLDPSIREGLQALLSSDPDDRLTAAIRFSTVADWSDAQLYGISGVFPAQRRVAQQVQAGRLIELHSTTGRRRIVHPETLERWSREILARLEKLHQRNPLAVTFELTQVTSGLEYLCEPQWLAACVERLADQGAVGFHQGRVHLANRQSKLTSNQLKVLSQIVEQISQAGFQPPTLPELKGRYPQQARELEKLLEIAVSDGSLVRINKEIFLAASVEQQLRERVQTALAQGGEMTVSEIRELLGTTRKFAVPFCEFLDERRITRRFGDVRRLISQSEP